MIFNKFLAVLFIATVLFAGCKHQATTTNPPNTAPGSTALAESQEPKQEKEREIIIDVRSQEEWDSGHLENAILIPHTEIAEKIAGVTEDKSAKLVLY